MNMGAIQQTRLPPQSFESSNGQDSLPTRLTLSPTLQAEHLPSLNSASVIAQQDESLDAKERYQHMWQCYSQGVQADNLIQLDFQVVQRAFEDGQQRKDIALMLVVGSPRVVQLHQEYGKDKARAYVNQVVEAICQLKQEQRLTNQKQQRQELEL
jgi:hypothetical protein